MSSLIRIPRTFDLTRLDRNQIIEKLQSALQGRVSAAFIFGSFALGQVHPDSDIDLIVVKSTQEPFTKRGMDFGDLFEIYPALDLLVYTPEELDSALQDPQGFWLSVRDSMIKIL